MATNRPHTKLNRTLIILLGIILACLLTLNARSLYSADLNESIVVPASDHVTPKTFFEKFSSIQLDDLVKKFHL